MSDHALRAHAARTKGLEILERLNKRYGIHLNPIVDSVSLSYAEKKRLLRDRIFEATLERFYQNNSDEGITYVPTEHDKLVLGIARDAEISDANVAVLTENLDIIRNYQGQALYDYLHSVLPEHFDRMNDAKTPGELALSILDGGLFSLGTVMGKAASEALGAGGTLVAAIRAGVNAVGMPSAISLVANVVATFVLYLFIDNPKQVLGFIINDTDTDFVVTNWQAGVDGDPGGDLWMEHGQMPSFMEDHEEGDLGSPLIQIQKRTYYRPNDADNATWAGFFFAKKNFGLLGAEGLIVLTPVGASSPIIGLQFAVPYAADNRTNIALLPARPDDMSAKFRDMYNAAQTRVVTTGGGYTLISAVNDPRGGEVALVASLTQD